MFSSKRKSRPPGAMLPPSDPGNVSKNALAAATAIGQAIRTGNPIPRSNSLQRTSSLQRNSFSNVPSRSSSLMGLQGPPKRFQEPQRQPQHRSQSITVASQRNKTSIQGGSSQSKGPRMVKKHIPGPYGLITIEVPAEEPVQRAPVKKVASQKRTQSLVKPKPSFSDFSSSRSRSSSNASSKRPTFADDLPEVQENETLSFNPTNPPSTPPGSKNYLSFIEEEKEDDSTPLKTPSLEDVAEKVEGVDELEKLKLEKKIDEEKIIDSLQKDLNKEQKSLTDATHLTKPEIFVEDEKPPSDYENDVLEQYTDLPSTAKSTDTLGAAQSSITTADSDISPEKEFGGSMAQQLRPMIQGMYHNRENSNTGNSALSVNDVNSSIYSEDNDAISTEDLEVPNRSEKRNNVSPRKSALKIKSSSSNTNLSLNGNNAASQAYLSLETAENTRLNALSASNHSSTSLTRSASSRVVEKPLNGKVSNHQTNGSSSRPPQSQVPIRTANRPPQRPVSALEHPSRVGASIQRPQSSQAIRSQVSPVVRPQSAQGFRQNSTQKKPQQQIPRSASNAAALNATLKKDELVRPPFEKKSSFEKERPQGSHAAFKRKSLRDPSFGGHQTVESNMGFYRHQAQQNRAHQQHSQQHQAHQQAAPPSQALEGFSSNFKSRFNDSDSDNDVPVANGASKMFAPPPTNSVLRKPNSSYTLRASSATGIPKNQSPAKSLPEKRATRYFSESDKEQLFSEQLEKAKAAVNDDKKKSKFGKLKKLFGRSKD